MVLLGGKFAPGCGPGTGCPYIHMLQCMLGRADAVMTEVVEPIRFVLANPTVVSKYSPVFSAFTY